MQWTGYIYRTALLLVAFITFTINVTAQDNHKWYFEYPEKIVGFTQHSFDKTSHLIDKYLDQKDSLYVVPNRYKLTLMVQYTNSYEYYRFAAPQSRQSITLTPENSDKIGFYIGWKWIFLGWAFDISKNRAKTDWNFSFYTSKIGVDLFYRKRSDGFRLSKIDGLTYSDGKEITSHSNRFDGISIAQKGINVYYIFNNKRFSYPAAYSQTTTQRISSGSFILGINYSEQSFRMDHTFFDPHVQSAMSESLKFNHAEYKDFSINFGYTYNWVIAKNYLANVSLTPGIGYKGTSLRFETEKDLLENINFDFITRAALLYNNSRYFIGASVISHTYSYRKRELSIINSFGTINVYAGINLFKK